jgi:hypothetical protein
MCYIEPKDSEMAQAHKKLWKEYKKLMQDIIQDPTNDKFVDGTITYDEVSKSITKAQNGKSAGPDGIVYEILIKLFQKILSLTWLQFLTVLIPMECARKYGIMLSLHLCTKKVIASTQKTFAQLYCEVQLQKIMRLPFSHELDMSLNGDGTHHQLINLTSGTTSNVCPL